MFWPTSKPTPPAIQPDWLVDSRDTFQSPSRFLIRGEIRLANSVELSSKYNLPVSSDEELISRLWESEGYSIAAELRGVFAFIVQDSLSPEAFLVRDPAGAKTFYYSRSDQHWVASPRLRTLRRAVDSDIDLIAMRDFLCCAFVPGSRTMWNRIKEIRPGCILNLVSGEEKTFWEIQDKTIGNESLEWHAARLRKLLNQVINESVTEDGITGSYLSGGLDSSLVTALASRRKPESIHTFSIHFGSSTPNELEFSSLVAQHCHTTHHIIEITPKMMWDLHYESISLLDDPIGDPLTVPNLVLGREAATVTKTILNGEGGDPCFGGPKNQPMLLNSLYTGEGDSQRQVRSYLASFQKCSEDLSWLFLPSIWKTVCEEECVFEKPLTGDGSYVNRLMFLNTRFKGADHILTKVNNLTSACGIEGRSPLFDQRIVAMSTEIPAEFKLLGQIEKAVLKEAVKDVVPEAILKRPKSGMMVPVQYWFREVWRKEARSLLLGRRARILTYLNRTLVDDWLNYRNDIWSRYGVKLWLLCSLELWLRANE